jgi:hypothetical protein
MGYGGVDPPFVTSALDGDEWSASSPSSFIPWETAPDTHWLRGSVGFRARLDTVEMRKCYPCHESNPGRSARNYID